MEMYEAFKTIISTLVSRFDTRSTLDAERFDNVGAYLGSRDDRIKARRVARGARLCRGSGHAGALK